MSSKKSRGGGGSTGAGDDSEDLTRPPPLQAILLADSFTLKFRPITLERPKVPAPRTLPTHHHLEIRAHVALLNPSAGAAPAGEHADDRVHSDVARDGRGGGCLRFLLFARAPGQGAPGRGRMNREEDREHARLGRGVARRYQRR
jgi:hypothetical protein